MNEEKNLNWKFSKNIEILRESPDWVMLRTSCECCDEKHNITITIEGDVGPNWVTMSIYQDLAWCDYYLLDFSIDYCGKIGNIINSIYEWRCKRKGETPKDKEPLKVISLIDFHIDKILLRLKGAARILFKGKVEVNSDIIFRSPEHIKEFTEMINTLTDKMEEYAKDNPEKLSLLEKLKKENKELKIKLEKAEILLTCAN